MSARALMTLAKLIVERATSNRRYAEASAKVCINVIEVCLKHYLLNLHFLQHHFK